MAKPHPQNAEGPFYVEDGCCITCGVPLEEAPGVFAWSEPGSDPALSCVVKWQPESPEDITKTLKAMISAEVDCIRYRGRNEEILRRIVEMGAAGQLDCTAPGNARRVDRDRVTFTVRDVGKASAEGLAGEFERHLEAMNQKSGLQRYNMSPRGSGIAEVNFSWFDGVFHAVELQALKVEPHFMAIVKTSALHPATQGAARLVDDWLGSSDRYENLRWYSLAQWQAGGPWRDTVV